MPFAAEKWMQPLVRQAKRQPVGGCLRGGVCVHSSIIYYLQGYLFHHAHLTCMLCGAHKSCRPSNQAKIHEHCLHPGYVISTPGTSHLFGVSMQPQQCHIPAPSWQLSERLQAPDACPSPRAHDALGARDAGSPASPTPLRRRSACTSWIARATS